MQLNMLRDLSDSMPTGALRWGLPVQAETETPSSQFLVPDPHAVPAHWETPHLQLRPVQASDLPRLVALLSDPLFQRLQPGSAAHDPQAVEALLQRWQAQWQAEGYGCWAVTRRAAPEEVLGFGGLMHECLDGQTALCLVLRLPQDAWPAQLGDEVAAAALALAFDHLHAEEVLAVSCPSHMPLRQTLTRRGLHLIGAWGDVPGQAPSLIYEISAARHAELHSAQAPLALPSD